MKSLQDVLEALSMTQRLQRSRSAQKNKSKMKMGRMRAMKKMASKETLMKRARKHARNLLLKKILKDVPKDELSMSRKKEIEQRLEKPALQAKIDKLARKLLPKIRKKEMERKKGSGTND